MTTGDTAKNLTVTQRIDLMIDEMRAKGFTPPKRNPKKTDVLLGPADDYVRGLFCLYTSLTEKLYALSKDMMKMQAEVRRAVPNSVHDDAGFEAWLAKNPAMKAKVEQVEATKEKNRPDQEILKVVSTLLQAEVALQYPIIRTTRDGKVPRINRTWHIVLADPEPHEKVQTAPIGVVLIGGAADFGLGEASPKPHLHS